MRIETEHAWLHLNYSRLIAQHPVVVIALAHLQFVKVIVDMLADAHWLAQIHRRPCNIQDAAIRQ